MKKVIIGSIQHEGNSFTPHKTRTDDFAFFKGDEMLNKVSVAKYFEEKDYDVIPTIYANALPSGELLQSTFDYLLSEMMALIPKDTKEISGVWLYLHGAMEVENIGSGDLAIIKEIRERINANIPISLALDFHANICPEYENMVNIICGYRTAPHTDMIETEIRAAKLLMESIEQCIIPQTLVIRVPIISSGDSVTTDIYPGLNIIEFLKEYDQDNKIMNISFFNGNPWVDAPNAGAAITISVKKKDIDYAKKKAYELGDFIWSVRNKFNFRTKTAEPEEAIDIALASHASTVFISDTGDNVTGGAAGDSAFYLKLLQIKGVKRVLIAGITDSRVVKACKNLVYGDRHIFEIGGEFNQHNQGSLFLDGEYIFQTTLPAWGRGEPIPSVLISTDGIDIIVTERRFAPVYRDVFDWFNIKKNDYKIVVVKLGYLFPELFEIAEDSVMAFTPGSTNEIIQTCSYTRIKRPMYPFDDNFNWKSEQ